MPNVGPQELGAVKLCVPEVGPWGCTRLFGSSVRRQLSRPRVTSDSSAFQKPELAIHSSCRRCLAPILVTDQSFCEASIPWLERPCILRVRLGTCDTFSFSLQSLLQSLCARWAHSSAASSSADIVVAAILVDGSVVTGSPPHCGVGSQPCATSSRACHKFKLQMLLCCPVITAPQAGSQLTDVITSSLV